MRRLPKKSSEVSSGLSRTLPGRPIKGLRTGNPPLPWLLSRRPKRRAPCLDDLADQYLAYYKATRSPASYGVAQSRLARFRLRFGTQSADDLTPGKLERWAAEQKWSPSATRGVLTVINSFLNWCVREKLIAENPVSGLYKPQMGRRTLLLNDFQVKRLTEEAKPDLKVMIQLLEATGARPHVLCQMQASNIDWEKGVAVMRSKGRQYLVYLPPVWLDYLRDMARRFPSGPLLRTDRGKAWKPNGLRQRLDRLGAGLGIRVYPYAFRHRYATRKLAEGCAPAVVAALLNHTDLTMISRHYSHVGSMHDLLRKAVE